MVFYLLITAVYAVTFSLTPTKSLNLGKIDFLSDISLSKLRILTYYDVAYFAYIEIGTPPKSMSFYIDTGSSYTWVYNIESNSPPSSIVFDSKLSSSFTNTTIKKDLYYGKGEVHGFLCKESFKLGNIIANSQDFVLVDSQKDLDSLEVDGLFGLGFRKLSDEYPTIIETLKSQSQIDRAIFSIFLSQNYEKSVITIGEYNEQLYGIGEKHVIKINSDEGYWGIEIAGVKAGDEISRRKSSGIVDSGTTLILGPLEDIKMIIDKINSDERNCRLDSGFYLCDCDKDFPIVSFEIDSVFYDIHPHNYLYRYRDKCVPLFSRLDDFWVLGQPFYREYYTIHDMDNSELYLYRSRESAEQSLVYNEPNYELYAFLGIVTSVIGYFASKKLKSPLDYNKI